jgi:hypothetical protein
LDQPTRCTAKAFTKRTLSSIPAAKEKAARTIEHCKLSKGEKFPANWQTPGQPINIDDNFWGSDYDGQEVPFNEDLPAYGVFFSKVSAGDDAFTIKVRFPNT